MDLGWITRLEWWHWWIAAAVLGAVESFMPGAVAIWMAVAAAVIGAVLLLIPIPWQLQLVLFAVLSIAAVYGWRVYQRKHPDTSDQPQLNQRGAQYIGRICELVEPIASGRGKARVGDGVWLVRGPDLPTGARVRVTSAEGAVLVVEAA